MSPLKASAHFSSLQKLIRAVLDQVRLDQILTVCSRNRQFPDISASGNCPALKSDFIRMDHKNLSDSQDWLIRPDHRHHRQTP